MKIRLILILSLICVLGTAQLSAQDKGSSKSDLAQIEQVIQNYFDGWLTGDSTLIGSAMHATCHLKFFPGGQFGMRDRNTYVGGFKPRPRLADAEGRIISVDITRNAAAAKVELEIPGRLFTDYFNLLKIEDRWWIMDKISTNVSTEKNKD